MLAVKLLISALFLDGIILNAEVVTASNSVSEKMKRNLEFTKEKRNMEEGDILLERQKKSYVKVDQLCLVAAEKKSMAFVAKFNLHRSIYQFLKRRSNRIMENFVKYFQHLY